MKVAFLLLVSTLLSFGIFADGSSLLDSDVMVGNFGNIRYRAPINDNNKKPIVLFHGIYGGASHRTWRKVLPILDQAGERVFIMDLPGVGESDKPKRVYSLEDMDIFVESFLTTVVKERATLVSESILSNGVLKVSSTRPDLVRRAIIVNPSGIFSLKDGPSAREQGLFERLFNNDVAAIAFYKNLLNPNSLRYFLEFGFNDVTLIDDDLIADFLVVRDNVDQRFLTLSFVGGQLYRSFEESSRGVFIPVLALFGKEYKAFQDNEIARAKDFEAVRPFFEYVEIEGSGSSVQREKPREVAQRIIDFSILD